MKDRSHLVHELQRAVADCPPQEVTRRLCGELARGLPVDAVTVSLFTDTPWRLLLCASSQMATVLEEVQFTVAEGPSITAATTGEPVHFTDWQAGARRWPLFTAVVSERCPDIQAVHAFPLLAGGGVLGSVDLASLTPGGMPADAIDQAAEAIDAAAQVLLQRLLGEGDDSPAWELTDVVGTREANTHLAIGVFMVRKGVTADTALALMRAHAFTTGRTLAEVTAEILSP
ncbi:GAF and ANTAR domain-containing protein (plasmid) [Streptomyces sp. NBC_00289]|uniref:GAF and ANTAR domain-containing protein n=1 Tax=Streptomyces sp. NBC_00289 TaxID=2975703 RepID=UPI002F9066D0